jgi:hypothetical protein
MNGAQGDAAEAERTHLIGLAEDWVDALVANEPGRLPIAPDLRATVDTVSLAPGRGIWRTIRGREPGGQSFAEPGGGQVEHWCVVEEMGRPAILAVRLKVEQGLIAEAETIVTRPGAFFEPAAIQEDASAGFHRLLAPEERSDRAGLVRIANLYFDAIERTDGSLLPVRGDCRRLVNGVVDALDDPDHPPAGEEHRALPVARQIDEGHYSYIEALRERRFPIVDVARGIALCHVLFDHPGDRVRPDGDLPIRSPNSMLFTEAFKIVGGEIEEIWALGSAPLPYGIGSGW